jgi:GMP reductase
MIDTDRALAFADIFLIPEYSELASRSEANTSLTLGSSIHEFHIPVMPSNMKCCINTSLAKQLSKEEYCYSMHRFGIDLYEFVRCANEELWPTISVSIGVSDKDLDVVKKLCDEGYRIDFLTVDIAHGHCKHMHKALSTLRKLDIKMFLIAGNVATPHGVEDLAEWGADAVKVGIGGGSVCSTKLKTGFTYPMFSCLQECAQSAYDVPIIADGGIRHNGDVVKALVAGASMVMAGNMFVACSDSPAETIYPGPNNVSAGYYKLYFGSASAQNKGEYYPTVRHIEGFQRRIQGNHMTYMQKMIELKQDISSAISYAGGKDLSIFKDSTYGVCK